MVILDKELFMWSSLNYDLVYVGRIFSIQVDTQLITLDYGLKLLYAGALSGSNCWWLVDYLCNAASSRSQVDRLQTVDCVWNPSLGFLAILRWYCWCSCCVLKVAICVCLQ